MKKTTVKIISIYQKTLSPDHGPLASKYPNGYCRYWPSCSEYTKIAIEENGVLKGTAKGAWRVLRCNPFSKGGVDMSCCSKNGVNHV